MDADVATLKVSEHKDGVSVEPAIGLATESSDDLTQRNAEGDGSNAPVLTGKFTIGRSDDEDKAKGKSRRGRTGLKVKFPFFFRKRNAKSKESDATVISSGSHVRLEEESSPFNTLESGLSASSVDDYRDTAGLSNIRASRISSMERLRRLGHSISSALKLPGKGCMGKRKRRKNKDSDDSVDDGPRSKEQKLEFSSLVSVENEVRIIK